LYSFFFPTTFLMRFSLELDRSVQFWLFLTCTFSPIIHLIPHFLFARFADLRSAYVCCGVLRGIESHSRLFSSGPLLIVYSHGWLIAPRPIFGLIDISSLSFLPHNFRRFPNEYLRWFFLSPPLRVEPDSNSRILIVPSYGRACPPLSAPPPQNLMLMDYPSSGNVGGQLSTGPDDFIQMFCPLFVLFFVDLFLNAQLSPPPFNQCNPPL